MNAHLNVNEAKRDANAALEAAKYGHLRRYHTGERVAYQGRIETILFVSLNSLGTLDDQGHGHLRFPTEVAGPLPEEASRLPLAAYFHRSDALPRRRGDHRNLRA
jgi:hypothetical protein